MGPAMAVLGLSLIVGGVIGRWWAVPIPIILVAGFYLGLIAGWWGHGVGDLWYAPMVLGFLLGIVGVWSGIVARKALQRRLTHQ